MYVNGSGPLRVRYVHDEVPVYFIFFLLVDVFNTRKDLVKSSTFLYTSTIQYK